LTHRELVDADLCTPVAVASVEVRRSVVVEEHGDHDPEETADRRHDPDGCGRSGRSDTPDEGIRTAELPMAVLDLRPGARLAYVFDFGDDWRVRLTFRERAEGDGGSYPRVLSRSGTAPRQYAGPDDE
jgi:Plasmid pRiA4b ORF-3-like protein